MNDMHPDEAALDRLFAGVPPVAPPVGLRDSIMRRVRGDGQPTVEWALAAILGLPSLAFLLWELVTGGLGLDSALASLMTVSASADSAFFFVDGMVVVAFALLGLGALVSSHALTRGS